ncbi:MAG: DUF4271 domain-containing protein [Dysgonamonadaceae bacterium]|jgi:hypothetical protein|nr:DUF4271 domain-containing protein [Dysgonamonadaceae bacterium]
MSIQDFNNSVFLLFLPSFFIFVYQIGTRKKMLLEMFEDLLHKNSGKSIFRENTGREILIKTLFCCQTLYLASLTLFITALRSDKPLNIQSSDIFRCTIYLACIFIAFILSKIFLNLTVGTVFFDRKSVRQWNSNIISILILSGTALFLPALFLYFTKNSGNLLIILLIILLILIAITITVRLYLIFFSKNNRLFYFILYLCAMEIIPFYLLYKSIMIIF